MSSWRTSKANTSVVGMHNHLLWVILPRPLAVPWRPPVRVLEIDVLHVCFALEVCGVH